MKLKSRKPEYTLCIPSKDKNIADKEKKAGIKYHCLYVALMIDNHSYRGCHYPGMDCVDALCNGYNNCSEYKKGSRKIKKVRKKK